VSWTYANPADDPKDAVRFLIGDTDESDPLISDEEIHYLLIGNTNPYRAAISACRQLAAKFAREVTHSADGLSYSGSDLHKHYITLAEELEKEARRMLRAGTMPYAGGISWNERHKDDRDGDLIRTAFRSHEHDHPETINDGRYFDPLKGDR
jgi:hypothetical protein